MFVDASVIVAILSRETGYEELEKRLTDHGGPFFISPLMKFEASLGLARKKSIQTKPSPETIHLAQLAVSAFIKNVDTQEVIITSEIGDMALAACSLYGKAVGHAADLNFGDCFAYACAKSHQIPLFYQGHDFAHTDLA